MVTNLGLSDAKALKIQAENALDGNTLDVPESAAEKLLKRGWAVAAKEPPRSADFSALPKAGKPNA